MCKLLQMYRFAPLLRATLQDIIENGRCKSLRRKMFHGETGRREVQCYKMPHEHLLLW